MEPASPLRLDRVRADERQTLANLLELYVHDLSAAFEVDIGPDGRFGYPKLDAYFNEPASRFAYLIRRGGDLLGFALVTRGSPAVDDPEVLDVAEYFVLRRHRRSGVGGAAVHRLLRMHPGRWVVRVSEANRGAHAFWQRTIDAFVGRPVEPGTFPGKRHPFRVYLLTSDEREARSSSRRRPG